jgi:hypothetical protein
VIVCPFTEILPADPAPVAPDIVAPVGINEYFWMVPRHTLRNQALCIKPAGRSDSASPHEFVSRNTGKTHSSKPIAFFATVDIKRVAGSAAGTPPGTLPFQEQHK